MKTGLLVASALLSLVPGTVFQSCVARLPPQRAQSEPGWISKRMDEVWHHLSRDLVAQIQPKHEYLRNHLKQEKKRLQIASDLLEPEESETRVDGKYGELPDVLVDQGNGAIFPLPISKPQRFSWYQAAYLAKHLLKTLKDFQKQIEDQKKQPDSEKMQAFEKAASRWNEINKNYVSLTQQIRYLETWVNQLATADQSRNSASIVAAIFQNDPSQNNPASSSFNDALREELKPHRILKRSFLPNSLEEADAGIITLPIATDIPNKAFLEEVEGALITHWNQSDWATANHVSFFIQWKFLKKNLAFLNGKENLAQHLSHFPVDHAGITTGSLTTYVRDRFLVLGPGTVNPRTLAHELGHIMGFTDCYLRTLTGQGYFGLGVLEWDNPFYPDDIMCDNSIGEPRVEVW